MRMLKDGLSITAVACYTGFTDQSHLSRRFKSVYGVTPGQVLGGRRPSKP